MVVGCDLASSLQLDGPEAKLGHPTLSCAAASEALRYLVDKCTINRDEIKSELKRARSHLHSNHDAQTDFPQKILDYTDKLLLNGPETQKSVPSLQNLRA